MTFAFRFRIHCPHCEEAYDSDTEFMLATTREEAGPMVLQKYRNCPICGHSLEDFDNNTPSERRPRVDIIAGDRE